MADVEAFAENRESKDESPVSLFVCFGKVYAWDADDVFKIRSKYRIVGSLIGSLPRKPRQNNAFALPLLLSREEATLLLNKGFARIFDMPRNFPTPSNEEVEKFNELRRESVVNQIEQFKRMQEERRVELAEVIEEGRKRKREKAAGDTAKAVEELRNDNDENHFNVICSESNDVDGNEGEKEGKMKRKRKGKVVDTDEEESTMNKKLKSEELSNESAEKSETREETNYNQLIENCNRSSDVDMMENKEETCSKTVTQQANEVIPAGANTEQASEKKLVEKTEVQSLSTNSETNTEELNIFSELGTLIHIPTVMPQRLQSFPSSDWTYPQTDCEKLRYQVFLDLWDKGYYLTTGVNFGGDFLAYPGDPFRYHSFYIVIIIPWGKKVTPFEFIAAGRLGASVKKTALLCSVSSDAGKVVYTSVKWSGIS